MASKALRDELANDPLGRQYSSMTDAEAAADLNTAYRSRERTAISGSEIFNAIDPTEWGELSDAMKQHVRDVFSLGDAVDISSGSNARTVLLSAFGAETNTRQNLVDAVMESITRADELGLPIVREGDVERAR